MQLRTTRPLVVIERSLFSHQGEAIVFYWAWGTATFSHWCASTVPPAFRSHVPLASPGMVRVTGMALFTARHVSTVHLASTTWEGSWHKCCTDHCGLVDSAGWPCLRPTVGRWTGPTESGTLSCWVGFERRRTKRRASAKHKRIKLSSLVFSRGSLKVPRDTFRFRP